MKPKNENQTVYGINPCTEVLRAQRRTIFNAKIADNAFDQARMKNIRSLLERNNIPVEKVPKGKLFEAVDTKDHQGVVLFCGPYPEVDLETQWDKKRLILLDNIEDPHNVGAILRSADVLGFHGVLLPHRGSPGIYSSVLKVSAGAAEHLDITRSSSANKYMMAAQKMGYLIIALDHKGKTNLEDYTPPPDIPLLLVIGGEDLSIGQYILNNADEVLKISMHGRVNSLNASVAAALAMQHLKA